MEATKIGRNAIGIDVESKYVKLAKMNIIHASDYNAQLPIPLPMGKAVARRGDARRLTRLVKSADVILTSPPYLQKPTNFATNNQHGNRGVSYKKTGERVRFVVEEGYGGSSNNIENKPYGRLEPTLTGYDRNRTQSGLHDETYLDAMLAVYAQCLQVLRPDSPLILILKNCIRNWKVIDLVANTVRLCERVGFVQEKTIRFKLNTMSFWRHNSIRQYERKFHRRFPHEEFGSAYDYETILIFRKASARAPFALVPTDRTAQSDHIAKQTSPDNHERDVT